jgi:uncharacterized protein YraI
MRTTQMLGGMAVVLLSTWSARAEPMPSRITQAEVTVRSGPSPEFYATGRLHRGDTVRIVREEANGWLAIVPPPGSFSWIHTNLVEQIGANAVVVSAADAQLWAGSRLINAKPTVWRTKVTKGTQLTIYGRPEIAQDGAWLPILPAPAEVRYIPADAVLATKASPQAAAAPAEPIQTAATSGGFASPRPMEQGTAPLSSNAGGSVAQPIATGAASSLPLQSSEAELAGNVARAKELTATGGINRPMASAAPPAAAVSPPQQPRAASQYCYVPDSGYTARLSAPVASTSSTPSPSEQWYEPGRLHRISFSPDGRPVYGFQPLNVGKRYIYVTPGPNVNLEPYVERITYLCGPMVYRGDLRTYYMTVLRVSPAQY